MKATWDRIALPRPCLTLVTDRHRAALPLTQAVGLAVAAGVDVVQVRELDLPPDELLPLAHELRAITAGCALLLVNGDLAAARHARDVGADGVHVRERGPSVAAVRALVGQRLLVGRSVHSVGAALDAEAEGADYVQVGAVYPTASHPGTPPAGLALVRAVRAAVALPLLAIGGITAENATDVLAAGADGVAVIGAILSGMHPDEAVRDLRAALARRPGDG